MRRNIVHSLRLITIVLYVSMSSACLSIKPVYYTEEKKAVREATTRFNDLLEAGDLESLYEMIDEEARRTKSREGFFKLAKQAHDTFGKINHQTILELNVLPRANDREVSIVTKIDSDNGAFLEKLVWRVDDNNKAKLFSFEVGPAEAP